MCFGFDFFVYSAQDFCYYANTIFIVTLLFYPKNEKLFMVCFSFAEVRTYLIRVSIFSPIDIYRELLYIGFKFDQGPLAWALIVWRCSLVFSSLDKIVSVLIHLLPGKLNFAYLLFFFLSFLIFCEFVPVELRSSFTCLMHSTLVTSFGVISHRICKSVYT